MIDTRATRRFPTQVAVFLGLAVGLLTVPLAGIAPVFAHNLVLDTIPQAGDTVTESPLEVHVITSDELLDLAGTGAGFAIAVQDEAGSYYGDGCVTIAEREMFTTVELGEAGTYQVTYQFVSADGHSLSENFVFAFAPVASHSPALGQSVAPQCGMGTMMDDIVGDETTVTAETPEDVVAEPLEADAELPGPSRDVITVAIAAVLIVLSITLLVWMVIRRNRG